MISQNLPEIFYNMLLYLLTFCLFTFISNQNNWSFNSFQLGDHASIENVYFAAVWLINWYSFVCIEAER